MEVEKRIFNVTHSFKYSSIKRLENAEIEKYIKILSIIENNFPVLLIKFENLFNYASTLYNKGIYQYLIFLFIKSYYHYYLVDFQIKDSYKLIILLEYFIATIEFITASMDNQQVYIRDVFNFFEFVFKHFLEKKLIEMILNLIVKYKNFNIFHQISMRFLEAITHKFIPDFVSEYLFEKVKLDDFLINHLFYFNNENIESIKKEEIVIDNLEFTSILENTVFKDKYSYNLKIPAYLPYITEIFKIFHFCDNNVIKGYIKKSII